MFCRLPGQNGEKVAQDFSHMFPGDNPVNHAVLFEIFCALESFREFLANGFFNHTRSRETNQCARFCEMDVAEHGVASRHAACCRIAKHDDVRQGRFAKFLNGNCRQPP